MIIALDKFISINGEWIFLSNLETDTKHIVLPDKYADLLGMSEPERDFIIECLRDAIQSIKYDYDGRKGTSKFEGLTAIPLKDYDGPFDHLSSREQATWH